MSTDNRPDTLTAGALSRSETGRLAAALGGDTREATAMVRLIWDALKGWDATRLLLNADKPVSDFTADSFRRIADRVIAGEPLQYVLGWADFYGMRLKVTPATLIPRPETAEMVDMIVDGAADRRDLDVLDIATGSGCIAIALARNLPFARVTATDISQPALDVADENARTLKARVSFVRDDILTAAVPAAPLYDIIVSNPPYIAESERESMEQRVVAHEPASALFVPDTDPLRFYDAISRYALGALRSGGSLWLEINPLFADRLSRSLRNQGWAEVTTVNDIHGRKRFIHAKQTES